MKTMTIVDRALQYLLVDGFSVIPVGKDKLPILKSWHEYQNRLPTEEEIKEWWTKYPQANVAILTGKISGITVVDVDTYRGASIKPFPKSYTVKTGNGGIQLYYKYASGYTISSNAYKDYPNVDIRGDGGYVVAPPSVTDYIKDGKRMGGLYELIDAQEFAPFPDHLFKDKKEKKSKFKLNVQSGSRNSDLASAIGTLLRPLSEKEFSKEGWLATQAINNTYKPPLPEKELQSIFESIAKKELTRRQKPQPTLSPIQLDDSDVIISRLRVNSNNVPYKDMTNAYLVISQHSKTAGKIKYNTFTQEIEFNGKALEETDLTVIVMILQKELLPNISKEAVYSAIQHYAFENRYDEAQNWLKSLVWDKKPRLKNWLQIACYLEDSEYHQGISTEWFMGIIQRIMNPGCIFDYVLVTVGKQGIGKTSLFRILGGKWYKSFTGTFDNKDFYLLLRGAIIMDLDEGATLYKSDTIKIKSIITQTQDEYRAPYDRVTKKYPRRFVFSMSTNNTEPFQDVTGNRRYWVIDLKKTIDFKWLEENREQLFAEGYYHYVNKTKLPRVPLAEAKEQQENHLPKDEWTNAIVDYLFSQPAYFNGYDEYSVTMTDIYINVLKGETLERLDRRVEIRIGNILKDEYFGLEKRRIREDGKLKYKYFLTEERKEQIRNGLHKKVQIIDTDSEADKVFKGL